MMAAYGQRGQPLVSTIIYHHDFQNNQLLCFFSFSVRIGAAAVVTFMVGLYCTNSFFERERERGRVKNVWVCLSLHQNKQQIMSKKKR